MLTLAASLRTRGHLHRPTAVSIRAQGAVLTDRTNSDCGETLSSPPRSCCSRREREIQFIGVLGDPLNDGLNHPARG
jgi:hypothetical protein